MSAKCSPPHRDRNAFDMQLASYGRSPLYHGHETAYRASLKAEGPVRREQAQLVMKHDFDPRRTLLRDLNHPARQMW